MKDFTAQQKEIVARKLGYDGPMQGFDEFIASSPALEAKYSAITGKYAERMAKGGLVKTKRNYRVGGDLNVKYQRDGEEGMGVGMPSSGDRTLTDDSLPTLNPPTTPAAPVATPVDLEKYQSGFNEDGSPNYVGAPLGYGNNPQEDFKYDLMQQGENVDGTPIYIRVPKGAAGNAALQPAAGPATPTTSAAPATGGSAPTAPVPVAGKASQVTAAQMAPTDAQKISTESRAGETATQVTGAATATAGQATATQTGPAAIYEASKAAPAVGEALAGVTGATGAVSKEAQVTAAQGQVSKESIAAAQKVGEEYKQEVVAGKREMGAGEMITPVTDATAVKATAAQTAAPTAVTAAQGVVQENQLVKAAQIAEKDMAQATAITSAGLAPDAKVVAARLEKFTVDDGTLAKAAQGDVSAQATVQGQLTELMKSFDDGATPAWAAGAMRAANAAMASRGLGGSSMAATAIFQAAMESALPIAAQDAKTFETMGLQNLNNRQQTSLANAAAQQGLSLANLNNEQQARLQNAASSFQLQSQNLSNMQQTMLANTQIRATLQGQNLSNQQQSAVVNAARYAEQANINLNNVQQTALHNSAMQVQVDIANTTNRQQTALANAQIEAALQGKILDNRQQAAVLNADKVSQAANLTFTAEQQAKLHNSEMLKSIGLAELSASQSATIANAATYAAMDTANLNARQQAAVANAQAFLAMDMKNLDNTQQTILFKAQATTQALLADTASANAAKQFNAASENQVTQFNATMATQVSQFNAAQTTAVSQFNTDQTNSIAKFNTEAQNQRQSFNASQRLVIDQSNAQWQREISTANTAATNAANSLNAQLSQNITLAEYNNQTQLYRDSVSFAWQQAQNDQDRANKLAITAMQAEATVNAGVGAAKTTAKGNLLGTAAKAAAMFFLSDERMKDIQGPITNALDKIKEIGGYSYTYKVEAEPFGYNSTITTMGVLAGQVKKVLPEAVKPASFNSTFDVVDYAAVNGLLVAAVNELITKVDLLSTRLNELEKK